MNSGQLKTMLRDQFLVDAQSLTKVSAASPSAIAEIEAAIEGGVRHEADQSWPMLIMLIVVVLLIAWLGGYLT